MVLRQPWAQAVVEGAFPALVRTLPTNKRGWVGVLATNNPDPAGFQDARGEAELGAIVGAVNIADCIEIRGDPRAFLANTFGEEIARFYPEHFLPEGDELHVWLLGQALPAGTTRDWDGPMPRTWARCSTWIEGEPIRLLSIEPETSTA